LYRTSFAIGDWLDCAETAEKDMKIYLLMLLIGTILTAIRFTSTPKQPSETLPQ
jgi:hypothetical protein